MKVITINRNSQFRRLYFSGRSCADACVVIYCKKNGLRHNRVGITVSKKIGNAVIRNRVRRRLMEVYRLKQRSFKFGFDIVFVARFSSLSIAFSSLERSLIRAAGKLGLLFVKEQQERLGG